MRFLILGGTAFVGRTVAARAVAAGHQVVCAARGVSGSVPAGAMLVPVNRDDPEGLSALDGQEFDALVDVASRPSHVRQAVAALAGRVAHWTYVSTISVYADEATPGQRATTAPVLPTPPTEVDDPRGNDDADYGPCKIACEEAVHVGVGADRAFLCRAGLIVGPGDPTDRFTYWPARLARGGRALAPGSPRDLVQYIDVRDLARWIVSAAETGLAGAYDAVCPPMTRADLLAQTAAGVGADGVELVWRNQQYLTDHEVRPWAGERSLPLWLPLPDMAGVLSHDPELSIDAGLSIRRLAETARDTLSWYQQAGSPQLRSGLSVEDEKALVD